MQTPEPTSKPVLPSPVLPSTSTSKSASKTKLLSLAAGVVAVVAGTVLFANVYSTNAHADGSVESLYQSSCATCHAAGVLGAPKTGDVAAWKKSTAGKTPEQLLASVQNGYKNMPARGLCNSCTADDYKALTAYMQKPKP